MQLTITLESGEKVKVKSGITILELLKVLEKEHDKTILAAYVNNKMKELRTKIETDVSIRFVYFGSIDGNRVYQRSASFILTKALHDIVPTAEMRILNSLPQGLYAEVYGGTKVSASLIAKVQKRMVELAKADLPFEREEMPIERAIAMFRKHGKEDKARLLGYRTVETASVYKLQDDVNYFFGNLAPSTGYIKTFEVKKHGDGFLLRLPALDNMKKLSKVKDSKKLYQVFKETQKWRNMLGVPDVGSLNEVIASGKSDEYTLVAEAFHEKKIASIADMIAKKKDVRIILISGPSSSGKTTFTKRLSIQLRVAGLKPMMVSMDDFFIDREKTPLDEHGEHDFESPYGLNIELFKKLCKKNDSWQTN